MTAKSFALLVLLAITVGIVVPAPLTLAVSQDGQDRIGTLDVCHSSTPALSQNGEMPCMTSVLCQHCPVLSVDYTTAAKPFFNLSLLPSDNEHPPKA